MLACLIITPDNDLINECHCTAILEQLVSKRQVDRRASATTEDTAGDVKCVQTLSRLHVYYVTECGGSRMQCNVKRGKHYMHVSKELHCGLQE